MSDDHFEPNASSPTEHVLTELQLYGYRPFSDEPDPRPMPEGDDVAGAITEIFGALIGALQDTRLEPDLGDLLWSTVNLTPGSTASSTSPQHWQIMKTSVSSCAWS